MKSILRSLLVFSVIGFSSASFAQTCKEEEARQKWFCDHPSFITPVKSDFKVVHQNGTVESWCYHTLADGTVVPTHLGPYPCSESGNPTPTPQPEPQPTPEPDYDPTPVTVTEPAVDNVSCQAGSIIFTDNQVLGETVPILGAKFELAYFSNKVVGRKGDYKVRIPLTGSSIDSKLTHVKYSVKVDGVLVESKTVAIAKNLSVEYSWNGLTAGKLNLGSGLAEIIIEKIPNGGTNSFAVPIGSLQAKNLGFGGWLPTNFHFYDLNRKQVLRGDGSSLTGLAEALVGNQLRVIDSSRSLVYIFDALTGRHLKTKTFWLGADVFVFNYDAKGFLSKISEPFNNVTVFNRNSSGDLISITSPNGQVSQITLDANKFISTITSSAKQVYAMTYADANGLLKTFKKPHGQVSTFAYDGLGKLEIDAHSGGYAVTLGKKVNGAQTVISSTSQMGRITTHATEKYKVPSDDGKTEISVYAKTEVRADGKMKTSMFSDNQEYVLDNRIEYLTVRKDDARFGAYAKTVSVNIASGITTFRGVMREETIELVDPSNPFSIKSYSLTETDQSNNVSVTNYDGENRSFYFLNPDGSHSFKIIDSLERIINFQFGNDLPTVFSYENDKLIRATQGDRYVEYFYDSTTKQLSSTKNALGQLAQFKYDAGGRLISTEYADGRKNEIIYDQHGKVLGITPAERLQHVFSYNSLELLLSYSPPGLGNSIPVATNYTYNADKQLLTILNPDGKKTTFNYDPATGTINSIVTPEGTYNYRFDPSYGIYDAVQTPQGLLSEKQLIEDGFVKFDILRKKDGEVIGVYSATPNNLGQVSFDAVTSNFNSPQIPLSYNYKADGKLEGVSSSFHNMSTTYDKDSGRIAEIKVYSGSSEVKDYYQYNSYGELTTYVASYNGTFLYSLDLMHDNLGRVISKIESVGNFSNQYEYSYNLSGRLSEVKKNDKVVSKYNYDSNGNRVSGNVNSQSVTANYDTQDRLATYNSDSFQYNLNGELLSKKNSITNQITPVSFNSLTQLTSIKVGSVTNEYLYDGYGRRVQNNVNGKMQSRFIYQGQIRLAGTLGSDGLVHQRFGYLSKSHAPDFMIMKNETYRFITDHLGSIRLVVRLKDGAVVQELQHDEFGRVVKNTAPGFQPFGFAGGLYDPNTNLIQFGARWYDPEVGRWISKDPIGFNGGDTNQYAYVANNPVNLIDVTGFVGQRPMAGIPDGAAFDENLNGGGGGSSGGSGGGSTIYVAPNGQAAVAPRGSTVGLADSGKGLKINLPNGGGEIRLMEPTGMSPNGYGKILSNGTYRDAIGNPVRGKSPEAHIQPSCPWKDD